MRCFMHGKRLGGQQDMRQSQGDSPVKLHLRQSQGDSPVKLALQQSQGDNPVKLALPQLQVDGFYSRGSEASPCCRSRPSDGSPATGSGRASPGPAIASGRASPGPAIGSGRASPGGSSQGGPPSSPGAALASEEQPKGRTVLTGSFRPNMRCSRMCHNFILGACHKSETYDGYHTCQGNDHKCLMSKLIPHAV